MGASSSNRSHQRQLKLPCIRQTGHKHKITRCCQLTAEEAWKGGRKRAKQHPSSLGPDTHTLSLWPFAESHTSVLACTPAQTFGRLICLAGSSHCSHLAWRTARLSHPRALTRIGLPCAQPTALHGPGCGHESLWASVLGQPAGRVSGRSGQRRRQPSPASSGARVGRSVPDFPRLIFFQVAPVGVCRAGGGWDLPTRRSPTGQQALVVATGARWAALSLRIAILSTIEAPLRVGNPRFGAPRFARPLTSQVPPCGRVQA